MQQTTVEVEEQQMGPQELWEPTEAGRHRLLTKCCEATKRRNHRQVTISQCFSRRQRHRHHTIETQLKVIQLNDKYQRSLLRPTMTTWVSQNWILRNNRRHPAHLRDQEVFRSSPTTTTTLLSSLRLLAVVSTKTWWRSCIWLWRR